MPNSSSLAAINNLSSTENETASPCVPSRNVVSKVKIFINRFCSFARNYRASAAEIEKATGWIWVPADGLQENRSSKRVSGGAANARRDNNAELDKVQHDET